MARETDVQGEVYEKVHKWMRDFGVSGTFDIADDNFTLDVGVAYVTLLELSILRDDLISVGVKDDTLWINLELIGGEPVLVISGKW